MPSNLSNNNGDDENNPPCYDSVLLETHLAVAVAHPDLFTSELRSAVESLLKARCPPTPKRHRTYHKLMPDDRNFPEGQGSYNGELDPKSRRNGFGHMVYSDGNIYVGFWKKGSMDGEGCFFWSDTGSVYNGEWKNGERSGKGDFAFGPRRNISGEEEEEEEEEDATTIAVCSGTWSGGKIKKGTGTVRFVVDGKVKISVEEDNNNKESRGISELARQFKSFVIG